MSFPEILEAVMLLDRDEKLQLMQVLANDVEETSVANHDALVEKYFPPGVVYEVATPLDCHEAAAVLSDLLKKEQGAR